MSRAVAQPKKLAWSTNMLARPHLLQRKCACGGTPGLTGECDGCRQKRLILQRSSDVQAERSTVPPIVQGVLRSPGQPLDAATRAFMESRFGHDFSRVRVHADARAAESARAVNAIAYTVQHHIAFDAGQYLPDTRSGQQLLAHELAHVVQQSRGGFAPLSLSRDEQLEQSAERVASALPHGNGSLHVAGSSAPVIARQTSKGKREKSVKDLTRAEVDVEVIPDTSARKLRVVLVGRNSRILVGLSEITPPMGAPLDPRSVQIYVQWIGDDTYPQVRIQTPEAWKSTINLRQDVRVQHQSEAGPFEVPDSSPEELKQLREDIVRFALETGSEFPELATTLAKHYELSATTAELKQAGQTEVFQAWRRNREAHRQIRAENIVLQQQLGLEGVSPAEAREISEFYRGRRLRTDWEREQQAKGTLQQYEEIRDPSTGIVVAYRERRLRGAGQEFYGEEEYVYDVHGRLISGQELAAKPVYGPQDYLLDPLGLQELVGVAESDPALGIATDLAMGAAKAGVKGLKGLRSLVRSGKRATTSEGLGRAIPEAIHPSMGGKLSRRGIVSSEQVAEAVAHQTTRARAMEAADVAAHQAVRVEAKEMVPEIKGATPRSVSGLPALTVEVEAFGAPRLPERGVSPEMPEPARNVIAERTAGGHEYRVLDDGRIIRCSDNCADLRHRLDDLALARPESRARLQELKKEFAEIEAIAEPELKARKAAEFDRQLDQKYPSVGGGMGSEPSASGARETWFRGQAVGVKPASPGEYVHDFGDGLYLTSDQRVAGMYAGERAEDVVKGTKLSPEAQSWRRRVFTGTYDRQLLGSVLDLNQDVRWQQFLQTRVPGGPTYEELIRYTNKNYWFFFKQFLQNNKLRLEDFDAIIGPEFVRGGTQICIRNPIIAERVRTTLRLIERGGRPFSPVGL